MSTPHLADFDLGDAPAPDRQPFSEWPPPAKLAAVGGAGCAGLVVLASLGFYALLLFLAHAQPPAGMRLNVNAPTTVRQGTTFPVVLTVHNTDSQPLRISTLAVRPPTLEKLTLENPKPAPKSAPLRIGGITWTYDRQLAPGEKWSVRFDATAKETGTLEGRIEVQVGFGMKPATFTVKATGKR